MKRINVAFLSETLERRVQTDIEEGNIYGSAMHVFQDKEVLYHNGVGTADPVTGSPVTDRTLFRMASMTKPITAVAALILMERGLLRLDDPISEYLPEYAALRLAGTSESGELFDLGPSPRIPTLRSILCHTSGIGSGVTGTAQIRSMTQEAKATLQGTVAYFSRQGLSFIPGTKQEYSGFPAYDVLTAIIEKQAGMTYESFLAQEVFGPCDMPDTTFMPSADQWQRLTVMHDKVDGKSTVTKMKDGTIFEGIPCTHPLGGAGLVSTLSDYSHFARMLLDGGIYGGKRIINQASVLDLRTAQVTKSIQRGLQRWGLGVRIITDQKYPYLPVGTYGWSGAYGPHFWIDPINRIAAVYLKNSKFDPGAGSVTGYHFEQDVYESML